MKEKKLACIILAAGKGERMKSRTPKVLHKVCSRPMLEYVLELGRSLGIAKTVVVLGHKQELVRKTLPAGIRVAIQRHLIGTADAVKVAMPRLRDFKGTVLILYGDIPLLKKESVAKLIKHHLKNGLAATLLTARLEKPLGYGRILRDKYSTICGIVEEKDADDVQKDIKEINTGIICFDKQKLDAALKKVKPNNRKKEYYLTDVIGILYKDNALIEDVKIEDINEALGINSLRDLSKANSVMYKRINMQVMEGGVNIVNPDTTFINYGAKIGRDTTIYPFTVIEKGVKIGKRCRIGPFAHLREGTELKDEVVAGNFVEVVRSCLGSKTLNKHFSYIGDSKIGRCVNIGAGSVTANFDGKKKNITVIKDHALIGSDTVLVAPVRIGKSAVTGAGSAVIRNVPDRTVVVGVPAKPLVKARKNG